MPEEVEIVGVRTNIDALSETRLHQALVDMVDNVAEGALTVLRALEPKRTGALVEHTTRSHVEDVVGLIEAKLGITAIGEAGANAALKSVPGAQDSSHYPVFVDRGTGVFGPTASPIFARVGHTMHFEEDGHEIFARSVKGQRGQHFIAATLAFAQTLLRTNPQIRLALAEMAATAQAISVEERA